MCARIRADRGDAPEVGSTVPDTYDSHRLCPMSLGGGWGGVAAAAAVPAAASGNSAVPAAGQDKIYKWPCPVHGVDAEHVFPPNLHASTIAQAPSGASLEICNICFASLNTALLVQK